MELHPFLHHHDTIGERGLPYRPDEAGAAKVLADLQTLSDPFGSARIRIEGDIGLLDLAASA